MHILWSPGHTDCRLWQIGAYAHIEIPGGERMINKEPESVVRVQFEHCDPFGHLNNMQYLSYIMTARTNHLRDFHDFDLFDHGKATGNNWVVARTRINYLSPVRFNEQMLIQTRLIYADDRRIVPEAVVMTPDKSRLHAVAWIEFAYFNVARARPTRHSAELLEFFKSIETPVTEFHIERIDQRTAELSKLSRRRDMKMVPHADRQ